MDGKIERVFPDYDFEHGSTDVFLPYSDEPFVDFNYSDPWYEAVCRAADDYYLSLGEDYEF